MRTTTLVKIISAASIAFSSLSFANTASNISATETGAEMTIIDSSIPVEAMVNYQGIIQSNGMEVRNGEIVLVANNESGLIANVLADQSANQSISVK